MFSRKGTYPAAPAPKRQRPAKKAPRPAPRSTVIDLATLTTSVLFGQLTAALNGGHFGLAYALADEICHPERTKTSVDLMIELKYWEAFRTVAPELTQGLADRIDQYNMNVAVNAARRAV